MSKTAPWLLILAVSCAGTGNSFRPTLAVIPARAELAPGQTKDFSVSLNYPPGITYIRAPVAWSVVEPGGGSVSPGGRYLAPAAAGTYHVKVQREDYPDVSAIATVTVTP